MIKLILSFLVISGGLIAQTWTPAASISTNTVDGSSVYGAYDQATGQVFAAWTGDNAGIPNPYFSTYTSSGGWTTEQDFDVNAEPVQDVVLQYIDSGPLAGQLAAAFIDEAFVTSFTPVSYFYNSGWGSHIPISNVVGNIPANVHLAYSSTSQTLYAAWTAFSPSDAIEVAAFDSNTNTWTLISPIPGANPTQTGTDVTLACDDSGNLFVFWQQGGGTPVYAIYNGSSWTTGQIGPSSALGNIFGVFNSRTGQMFAAWGNGDGSRDIAYSIYSNGSWSNVGALVGADLTENVYLAYDSDTGSVYASWVFKTYQYPYYAFFPQGGSWSAPAPISTDSTVSQDVTLVYDSGLKSMFALWKDTSDRNTPPFFSMLFIPPTPSPITDLTGRRMTNDFGTVSEWYTVLRWTDSPDAFGYHIYEDGVLIATLGPFADSYSAHNQSRRPATFTVTAFNNVGDSSPVSITIR